MWQFFGDNVFMGEKSLLLIPLSSPICAAAKVICISESNTVLFFRSQTPVFIRVSHTKEIEKFRLRLDYLKLYKE